MRPRGLRTALAALLGLAAACLLAACSEPDLNRVDVTWNTDPPPRWGLYPGYRQEIPCPRGSTYQIDVYFKDKPLTGGAVADLGYGLAFRASAGSRDIEAVSEGRDHMTLFVTVREKDGTSRRQKVLRIDRAGEKIWFEFLKE